MPLRPDVIAGRYRVLDEAGRGGIGAVYHCADDRLGREVAVKQVGRTPGESVTDQARALREARSTAALNHPHVVSVYDAVAEDDHIWLVMEYVPGRTLAQLMREDGPLPPTRAARICVQVAEGLAAAHERGTVHRDVKPGNILVAEGDVAKISDFGIARTAGDATLTQTGMLSGTPAYLAPEVARGDDPGPASDVWGLGATLFAAVEGRPLFENKDNALALLAVIAAASEPPSPERAGPLAGPIRRMLDPDPTSRSSMADVVPALHRLEEQPGSGAETREETPVLAVTEPVPAAAAAAGAPRDTGPRRQRTGAVADFLRPRPRPGDDSAGPGCSRRVWSRCSRWSIVGLVLFGDDRGLHPQQTRRAGVVHRQRATRAREHRGQHPRGDRAHDRGPHGDHRERSVGAAGRTEFVEDYYAVLPEDTRAGYELLSPSYQERTKLCGLRRVLVHRGRRDRPGDRTRGPPRRRRHAALQRLRRRGATDLPGTGRELLVDHRRRDHRVTQS